MARPTRAEQQPETAQQELKKSVPTEFIGMEPGGGDRRRPGVTGRRPGPQGVDPLQPHSARIWNYLLDGKDNYELDRAVAQRLLQVAPDTRTLAWFSRKFLTGAARLAAENGVRQFVDLGAGLPMSPSVFEVAKEIEVASRVVSVDYDPVVHAHANAMLEGESGTVAMLADIREPDELIHRLSTEARIDFAEPVGVLAVGVLDHVMDDEHPA